jgi:hypothetical protein
MDASPPTILKVIVEVIGLTRHGKFKRRGGAVAIGKVLHPFAMKAPGSTADPAPNTTTLLIKPLREM